MASINDLKAITEVKEDFSGLHVETLELSSKPVTAVTNGVIKVRKGWTESGEVEDAIDEPSKKLIGVCSFIS